MTDVIVAGPKEEIARFVAARTKLDPARLDPGYTAIGLQRDGVLIAGVIFEGYTGTCVELHMAGDGGRWITKKMLRMVFRYAFEQLGCKVVRGRVPSWNLTAIKTDMRLGFALEHVLKDADPDGDQWLMAMWKKDCRFLEV